MKTLACLATAILLGLVSLCRAHMEMKEPPPIRSRFNKYTEDIDYDMISPLEADGSNFPCKGYHKLVGTPQGKSVATWVPGRPYSMTITGNTPHNGGSCQASLSYDGGKTWTVIHSYIGHCPVLGDSSYQFALPADTPPGEALFAWSWFNQVGNREMYMNCAAITIQGGGGGGGLSGGIGMGGSSSRSSRSYGTSNNDGTGSSSRDDGTSSSRNTGTSSETRSGSGSGSGTDRRAGVKRRGTSAPFGSRPNMFVANVANGCGTIEGSDVMFPHPGPDVDLRSENTAPPTGHCPY